MFGMDEGKGGGAQGRELGIREGEGNDGVVEWWSDGWWVKVTVGGGLCRNWGEAVAWDRGVKPLLRLKAYENVCASLCVLRGLCETLSIPDRDLDRDLSPQSYFAPLAPSHPCPSGKSVVIPSPPLCLSLRFLRSFVAIFPITSWRVAQFTAGGGFCHDWGEAVAWDRGVKPLLQLKAITLEPAPKAGPLPFSHFFDQDYDHRHDQD